jgi:hypothetical protein
MKEMKGGLIMKNTILTITFALAVVFMIGNVLAQDSRVKGDVNLVWQNYGDQPQNFAGSITGDLSGTLNLIAHVDYDSANPSIGNTFADLTATINGNSCEGSATLSNINYGTDKGSFYLICGETSIDGNLYGNNAQNSSGEYTLMNLKYDAKMSNTTQIPGKDGKDGIDGTNGKDGINGNDGLPGLNGKDGLNGINGLPGAKGDQGIQGIQGLQGLKGDTGSQGIPGTNATVDLSGINSRISWIESVLNASKLYAGFNDFWVWFGSPKQCTNGALQCSGNNTQLCVNYAWTTQSSCQYGCLSGVCKSAPIPPVVDCTKKAHTFSCSNSYSIESAFYGTAPTCTSYQYYQKWCGNGCNTLTGLCK